METIKNENVTSFYMDGQILLTITELQNDIFIVENSSYKIKGYAKVIDEHRVETKIDEYYSKGKTGRLYKTKKLIGHNEKWFVYILQEYNFISKTKPTK